MLQLKNQTDMENICLCFSIQAMKNIQELVDIYE